MPRPRKDMTQKEEYQYLEMDPFMDFAEMTRLFLSMQQRTFYRWKRRIKVSKKLCRYNKLDDAFHFWCCNFLPSLLIGTGQGVIAQWLYDCTLKSDQEPVVFFLQTYSKPKAAVIF